MEMGGWFVVITKRYKLETGMNLLLHMSVKRAQF